MAPRIASKSPGLSWMSLIPVTSAVAAITTSNRHLASLSVFASARRCDLFGGVGGSGISAITSPPIVARAALTGHTRRGDWRYVTRAASIPTYAKLRDNLASILD